ncbi:hypothetical protein T02_14315 [Trichinella nativa]|uniref:Uncharacterized protein n=1 Tax=Trichinella nativa TaxID=6335 RepID=A0A0V1L383_9BILA|nr:hypothetical protein T02_14315 [Trichinella nativa]
MEDHFQYSTQIRRISALPLVGNTGNTNEQTMDNIFGRAISSTPVVVATFSGADGPQRWSGSSLQSFLFRIKSEYNSTSSSSSSSSPFNSSPPEELLNFISNKTNFLEQRPERLQHFASRLHRPVQIQRTVRINCQTANNRQSGKGKHDRRIASFNLLVGDVATSFGPEQVRIHGPTSPAPWSTRSSIQIRQTNGQKRATTVSPFPDRRPDFSNFAISKFPAYRQCAWKAPWPTVEWRRFRNPGPQCSNRRLDIRRRTTTDRENCRAARHREISHDNHEALACALLETARTASLRQCEADDPGSRAICIPTAGNGRENDDCRTNPTHVPHCSKLRRRKRTSPTATNRPLGACKEACGNSTSHQLINEQPNDRPENTLSIRNSTLNHRRFNKRIENTIDVPKRKVHFTHAHTHAQWQPVRCNRLQC